MYESDTIEEILESVSASDFKYGITRDMARSGHFKIIKVFPNPQALAKDYPEYFI